MPFDATVTFSDGSQHVYKGVPDGTAPEAVSELAGKEFGKQVAKLDGGVPVDTGGLGKETLRVGGKSLQEGLPSLPGLGGDIALAGLKQGGKPGALANVPPFPGLPLLMHVIGALGKSDAVQNTSFGDVTKQLQTVGGLIPKVEPKTETGQRLGSIGASVVGNMTAPGAGGLGFKAGMGATSGTAAEGAGMLTDDNPIAKVLAALLGSFGYAGASKVLRPNAKELIQDGTSTVDKADWRKAFERQDTQRAAGIPALASQNVPNSTLPDMVSQAAMNPRVGPGLKKKVAGSEQNAADAVNAWSRKNLPIGQGLDQTDVLNAAQGSAEKALGKARDRAGSAYGAKVPDLVNETEMPADKFKSMVDELESFIQRADVGENSEAGKAVRKFIDTKLHQPGGGSGEMQAEMNALAGEASAGPKQVRLMGNLNQFYKELNQLGAADDFKGLPVQAIRSIMKKATPEYDPARSAWRSSMENDYAVSANGLTGDLANFKGGQNWDKSTVAPAMLDKIFGPGRDNTLAIRRLAQDIGDDQVGALLREHISRTLGNTIKETKSGAQTLQTPADFTSSLAGNSVAKKNLEAALEVAARAQGHDPAATTSGFWKLMDALNTTKNLRLPDMVDTGVMQDIAGKNVISTAIAPRLNLHRAFRVSASTKTYQEIADIVTSPNGLAQLEKLAGEKDPTRLRQAAISVLIEANKVGQSQREQRE